ncbi:MAG: hypothetical protein Q8O83_02450 [bacterium]|nr:hypothetical protein [bacterium]
MHFLLAIGLGNTRARKRAPEPLQKHFNTSLYRSVLLIQKGITITTTSILYSIEVVIFKTKNPNARLAEATLRRSKARAFSEAQA